MVIMTNQWWENFLISEQKKVINIVKCCRRPNKTNTNSVTWTWQPQSDWYIGKSNLRRAEARLKETEE